MFGEAGVNMGISDPWLCGGRSERAAAGDDLQGEASPDNPTPDALGGAVVASTGSGPRAAQGVKPDERSPCAASTDVAVDEVRQQAASSPN